MGTIGIDGGNTITMIDAAPLGCRSLSSDNWIDHLVLMSDRMRGMSVCCVEVTIKFLIILIVPDQALTRVWGFRPVSCGLWLNPSFVASTSH
jgi:hypothetical protein